MQKAVGGVRGMVGDIDDMEKRYKEALEKDGVALLAHFGGTAATGKLTDWQKNTLNSMVATLKEHNKAHDLAIERKARMDELGKAERATTFEKVNGSIQYFPDYFKQRREELSKEASAGQAEADDKRSLEGRNSPPAPKPSEECRERCREGADIPYSFGCSAPCTRKGFHIGHFCRKHETSSAPSNSGEAAPAQTERAKDEKRRCFCGLMMDGMNEQHAPLGGGTHSIHSYAPFVWTPALLAEACERLRAYSPCGPISCWLRDEAVRLHERGKV